VTAVTAIVVCDRQPHIRQMLALLFGREELETHCLADGASVLPMVSSCDADIVILNTDLGSCDGYSVCREIRASPGIRQPHLIMLTAEGQDLDRQNALLAGFDEFRFIPFSPRSLVRHVRRVLEEP
jgi:two-component system, OmpR family, alkaline phosphatase synthesis response regulator PhoP